MASLNFKLLAWQKLVHQDKTRFKVVVAGRRCGKSRQAAIELLLEGLQCPEGSGVMYVAPTQGQARVIIWNVLMELGREVIASAHVNNSEITLVNGVVIYVRGADRPDTLRGVSLWFVVLDEFADMKPSAWEQVIRASLSDKRGKALFIGTPKGRNHFYDLYKLGESGDDPEWKSWTFTTADNELIHPDEILAAKKTLSSFAFKQEYMASFDNIGTDLFKEEWIKYGKEPEGSWYIAIDLAGFEAVSTQAANSKKRLDQTAISVVKVTEDGKWFVKKIEYGRWDIRETAVRILKNIREFRPLAIGMEKGSLANAVMPYLTDLMRKNSVYAHIIPLTHGNRKKDDRIIWSLQGRFEHGRIILNMDEDWTEFKDQLLMFPTKGVHDDLCFIAGTKISTINGLVNIEDIKQGDYVLTPIGYKQVLASKLTNNNAEVYSLNDELIGTGNHPVMTNNGWISLQNISSNDKIVHLYNRSLSWVSQLKKVSLENQFISMGSNIIVILSQLGWLIESILQNLVAKGCYTGMYGNSTMEQSQMDSIYITKMKTLSTTTFQISNVYHSVSTEKNTQKIIAKEESLPSNWNTSKKFDHHLLLGTALLKVLNGINSTVKMFGLDANLLNILVVNAELNLNRLKLQEFIIAQGNALQQHGEKQSQIITLLKQRQPVYNLTVKEAHSYYANGILVHNCDSLSYIDQMATVSYSKYDDEEEYDVVDVIVGF